MPDFVPPTFFRPWRAPLVSALVAMLSLAALPATAQGQMTIDHLELQLDPG